MATLTRICKTGRSWRTINSIITRISSPSLANRGVCYGNYKSLACISTTASEKTRTESVSEFREYFLMLHVLLAGGFGTGMLNISHADANEAEVQAPSAESPSTESPPSDFENLEKIVRQERLRLEDLLKSKGMLRGSYPPFSVAVKGQKVTVKFQIPPTCESSHLIVDIVSHLGLTAEKHGGGSDMVLRAWDSPAAWQMTLNSPKKKEVQTDKELLGDKGDNEGDLCVFIFQSLISSENAEIEFIKNGSFSTEDLDALVSALKLAGSRVKASGRKPRGYPDCRGSRVDSAAEKSVAALEAMGVRVFGLKESPAISSTGDISWENIAGYDQQKREIEDTILLVLHSPEVYDDIARGTRCKFESNRPRAVLFEGPPGTGKTSCARVIANQAGVPLLYVPLEVVMSKYYGESERLLGSVFSLANELSDGAIIFLDEVDSFAIARDDGMHEATRRILSVLLRQVPSAGTGEIRLQNQDSVHAVVIAKVLSPSGLHICPDYGQVESDLMVTERNLDIDGFEQEKRVVVIAATNRKEDLDPALISRFDSMITFDLPDQGTREEISAQYARHLKKPELIEFAAATEGMSGRDIRDVCQQAERHWASKIIRGKASSTAEQGNVNLPPLQEYLDSALTRQNALLSISEKRRQKSEVPRNSFRKSPMDFL